MDQQEIVADYENRAAAVGLSVAGLCREAGLAASTFSRWKQSDKNPTPIGMTFASMSAIDAVLKRHEAASAEPQEHAA